MSNTFRLKINALDLPNYRFIHTPNCYARITIDGGHTFTTKPVSGSSPQWNECFDTSLEKSTAIKVELFHVKSSSKEVLRGTASIIVGDPLPGDHETIASEHKLHLSSMKSHKPGIIVVSLSRNPEHPVVTAASMDSNIPNGEVPHIEGASHSLKSNKTAVLTDLERAEVAVGKFKGYHGTAVNPDTTATCSEIFGTIIGYVEKVVEFGDILSQIHPYAQVAWNVLTAAQKALQSQEIREEKIKNLLMIGRDMLEFVEEADAASKISKLQATVSSMMVEIRKLALFIQEYGKQRPAVRLLRDNLSTTTDNRIDEFIATFEYLKSKFDSGINIETFNAVQHVVPMLENMDAAETEKLLERLPGWNLEGVKFNESKTCLDGTRKHILDNIRTWAFTPDDKCMLWLSGGAGTGKTSIANSTAVVLDNLGCLGACFCFNRDTAGLNNSNYLFGSLCYQLAHFKEGGQFQFKRTIMSAIYSMGHVASSSLYTQARKLIVDTTNAVRLVGPVVLIIDALDESGSMPTRKELLDAIATEFLKLPQSIKVMITSRDEPDIRASLRGRSKEIHIDNATNTEEDIASYVQHRLTAIRRDSRLPKDWPDFAMEQELVQRAGHLFIWAAVACNFVEEKLNPAWRLKLLLVATSGAEAMTGSPWKKLDNLYDKVLRNAFPDEDDPLADFRYVVGSIIALQAPLTRSGLDSLLGLGDRGGISVLQNGHEIHLWSSDEIVSALRSILRADTTDNTGQDGALRLLHPSLYEFLTTRADERFRIDPTEQHRILAMRCLIVMNSQLKFDICNIGDSSLLNKEISDLSERVNTHISDGLRYSCHSIGYHLDKVSIPDTELRHALKMFVSEHLLHWIEVMSILEDVVSAEGCLCILSGWMKAHMTDDVELRALVRDSIPFLRNSGHAVRLSALHTYYSALPLVPKSTDLFERFIHNDLRAPIIISSHPAWSIESLRVMEGHGRKVNDIVFSPDGTKLASASHDWSVRLWDVESGQAIGEPLEGHKDGVAHVVFSPDGNKLVSTSYDNTICIWDIESRQIIGQTLAGHRVRASCVGFSPDVMMLASASEDATVRLWAIGNHRPTQDALESVTVLPSLNTAKAENDPWNGVPYVMFSQDGKTLAATSWGDTCNSTVRLWDLEKGHVTIGRSLDCCAGPVEHFNFSPDGKKLAAVSWRRIQLWDVESGKPIGDNLHTGQVKYVTFSPDGKKLASASRDETVRLWDVESGMTIRRVLKGHIDTVNCVAFSPDGRQLASASDDKTARLWNVESGEAISQVLRGHTARVTRVIFSPDGRKLATASSDHTIQLWDVDARKLDERALKGHIGWVSPVVFSPDGVRMASASSDKTVRLWHAENAQPIGDALEGHTDWVLKVAFSPDGATLASASADKTVRLWNVDSHQEIGAAFQGHTDWVHHVVFSPDGKKLASGSGDMTARIWDVGSGQAIGGALKGHNSTVHYVVFSPDGKILASASFDATVRLWDADTLQLIGTILEGHTEVFRVFFSPDGKRLASLFDDNTLRIWNVETGGAVGELLQSHTDLVMFSSNGQKCGSVSYEGRMRIVDAASGEPVGDSFDLYADSIHKSGVPPRILDVTTQPRLKEFIYTTNYEFEDTTKLVPESLDKIIQETMSFDKQGFLRQGTTRLLWLPVMLRGSIVVRSPLVVVSGGSGVITVIRFPDGG